MSLKLSCMIVSNIVNGLTSVQFFFVMTHKHQKNRSFLLGEWGSRYTFCHIVKIIARFILFFFSRKYNSAWRPTIILSKLTQISQTVSKATLRMMQTKRNKEKAPTTRNWSPPLITCHHVDRIFDAFLPRWVRAT